METLRCAKNVQIRSFFWSVFSNIYTEYEYLRGKSLYSVQIRENTDQMKLRIWTLFTQCFFRKIIELSKFLLLKLIQTGLYVGRKCSLNIKNTSFTNINKHNISKNVNKFISLWFLWCSNTKHQDTLSAKITVLFEHLYVWHLGAG